MRFLMDWNQITCLPLVSRARLSWLGIVATILTTAACASTGATPRPFPMPGPTPPTTLPGPASLPPVPGEAAAPVAAPPRPGWRTADAAYALVGTALELRGAPYRNGGVSPSGFDCSGFTQYVFAQHGVALPREVREQFKVGKVVGSDKMVPGDLIFFTTTAPGASHVGIALGGDEFVHAPSATGVVRVEHLSSRYWSPRFLGIRRVMAD
jgi:cell wall-associated NlpC family hydrolase